MQKISIIVPVYNAEEYLDECVSSIVNQTHLDIEILLIDDGSNDNSKSICLSWQEKDNRIKVISKENQGVSATRNLGIENACGDYVCFVDSDDFVSNDYCEKMLSHMDKGVDFVALGLAKVKNGQTKLLSHRLKRGKYKASDVSKMVIDDGTMSGFTLHSPCAVLYRKEILNKCAIRFNSKVHYNEDGLFNAQYLFNCKNEIFVDYSDAVYFYRTNMQSATKKVDLFGERYLNSMQEIENALSCYIDQGDFCIQEQLWARKATLALSQLIFAVSKKDKQNFKKVIRDLELKVALGFVNKSKLNKKKKIIYYLMKFKFKFLLKIALNTYVKRG